MLERSKHTIAIFGLPHQSFENRAIPLYIADKSNQLYCDDGWLLHTICFYGSNERQGISIFAFTDSVGRTDTSIPFNKKSFERGEHARVYESYVCSVPSSSVSPSSALSSVCAHFHHGRISRGSRCEGERAAISPAAQTGVAYPINANVLGEQASKNLFGVVWQSIFSSLSCL